MVGLLVGSAGCVLGGQLLVANLLDGSTGAESARNELLGQELPHTVRDLEVANPDRDNVGPATVAWLAEHFQRPGETVLRSSSTPGRPPAGTVAGSIDVRLTRTAGGDSLGEPTESQTITICVRFETELSDGYGVRTTFREIKCP